METLSQRKDRIGRVRSRSFNSADILAAAAVLVGVPLVMKPRGDEGEGIPVSRKGATLFSTPVSVCIVDLHLTLR
ncbi:unnamed protein product [Linum trigynum]|uniref:Uncharacterized protein n=1 Tax=Linum trigynum TaxID=586398 RepID=A0AAV2FBF7_9ROSI